MRSCTKGHGSTGLFDANQCGKAYGAFIDFCIATICNNFKIQAKLIIRAAFQEASSFTGMLIFGAIEFLTDMDEHHGSIIVGLESTAMALDLRLNELQ